jgi:two-component system, sensor histidine kinase RegB
MSSHAGEAARTDHEVLSVSRFNATHSVLSSGVSPTDAVAASTRASNIDASARVLGIGWLVRLRWLSLVGQLVAYVAEAPNSTPNQRLVLGLVVLCTALSNIAIWRFPDVVARLASRRANSKYLITGSVLTLDCFLLTLWLGIAGATTNPFSVLYLVHIVLGAVVLDLRWTTWLNVFAVLCYGSLFLLPNQTCCTPGFDGVESAYLTHMQGMWFAFIVAALLTSYFVRQLTVEAERQRQQIEALQLSAQRSAHMASLTTLAAGTAHELRTPLATISVAAHELHRNAHRLGNKDVVDDAELIAAEVDRCQEILSGMGLRLRGSSDLAELLDTSAIVAALTREFEAKGVNHEQLRFVHAGAAFVRAVQDDLLTALRCVINNALDATAHSGSVQVTLEADGSRVTFCVADSGVGMAPDVQARALEPFFSTKGPGKGVGLGLFVAQAFAFQNGGNLTLESSVGHGTIARLTLPADQSRSAG